MARRPYEHVPQLRAGIDGPTSSMPNGGATPAPQPVKAAPVPVLAGPDSRWPQTAAALNYWHGLNPRERRGLSLQMNGMTDDEVRALAARLTGEALPAELQPEPEKPGNAMPVAEVPPIDLGDPATWWQRPRWIRLDQAPRGDEFIASQRVGNVGKLGVGNVAELALGVREAVVQPLLLGRERHRRLEPRRAVVPCPDLVVGQTAIGRALVGRAELVLRRRCSRSRAVSPRISRKLRYGASEPAVPKLLCLSTPWEANADAARHLTDINRTFLDPEWERRGENLDANLVARGLTPGSEAYGNARQGFADERSRAYDQMYLDAYRTAVDVGLRERNQPLTELTSMLGLTQPNTPQFQNTPTPGVTPVDYTGLVQSNFANKNANYQAMLGGLFSIPATIAGGWASGAFRPGAFQPKTAPI